MEKFRQSSLNGDGKYALCVKKIAINAYSLLFHKLRCLLV